MSFFRKRLKLEDRSMGEAPILINKPISGDCPPLFQDTGLCVCMTCPRLGTCRLEKVSKCIKVNGQCVRPIRACSVKAMEKGAPPACSELILEEFFEYINGKYLRL